MFNKPFDLPTVLIEATSLYKHETQQKGLDFEVDLARDLCMVVRDLSKVRIIVADLTANSRKEPSFLICLPCVDCISVSEIHAISLSCAACLMNRKVSEIPSKPPSRSS